MIALALESPAPNADDRPYRDRTKPTSSPEGQGDSAWLNKKAPLPSRGSGLLVREAAPAEAFWLVPRPGLTDLRRFPGRSLPGFPEVEPAGGNVAPGHPCCQGSVLERTNRRRNHWLQPYEYQGQTSKSPPMSLQTRSSMTPYCTLWLPDALAVEPSALRAEMVQEIEPAAKTFWAMMP